MCMITVAAAAAAATVQCVHLLICCHRRRRGRRLVVLTACPLDSHIIRSLLAVFYFRIKVKHSQLNRLG